MSPFSPPPKKKLHQKEVDKNPSNYKSHTNNSPSPPVKENIATKIPITIILSLTGLQILEKRQQQLLIQGNYNQR